MVDTQSIEQIKSLLDQGKTKEDIYKELLSQGVTIASIEESFNNLSSEEKKDDTHKKTTRIILTFAVLLIGVGIFSFIASNWQMMPNVVKIFIIIASMVLSYVGGWYLREKLHYRKTGGAFILLGAVIYGAGIFLLGQMFNIRANWPDGFILWMLGVIALGYATEIHALFYLAILLGIVAVIGHPFDIFSHFSSDNSILTSSFLLATATITTFIVGFVIRRKMLSTVKEY